MTVASWQPEGDPGLRPANLYKKPENHCECCVSTSRNRPRTLFVRRQPYESVWLVLSKTSVRGADPILKKEPPSTLVTVGVFEKTSVRGAEARAPS